MRIKNRFPAILTIVIYFALTTAAPAAEVDFSCMSYKVWSNEHTSSQFMDSDVVLHNRCPGAVYWAMCIERMDPFTNKIVETHTPTGYLEAQKKARVNLHLRRGADEWRFRNRFEEFYVNFGYAIEMPVSADCFASQCEAKKRDLRAQVRTNEAAWERAAKSLNVQISNECPNSGWDTTPAEECEAAVREASQTEMELFPMRDQELRTQMAVIDREHCQVHSGELTGD
jgi:hypothetical protein